MPTKMITNVNKDKLIHVQKCAKLLKLRQSGFHFRLDYCNVLFTDLGKKLIRQLQLIHNPAARVLTNSKKMEHITPLLKSMLWLPVCQRMDFKILSRARIHFVLTLKL